MTLRDLEYFSIVAEHGKFSAASEICYVSQPTVSGQMKKLEEELGQPLFERSTRQVFLTSFGREILPHVQDILKGIEKIELIAQESQDPLQGEVSIGVFPTLGPWLLPQIITILKETFPKLKLYLIEEQTAHLEKKLIGLDLDAAILAYPSGQEGLSSIPLFEEEFWVALPAQHPWSERDSIDPNELKDESLLLLDEGHCFRDQALELCHMYQAKEHNSFRATSIETLRQMVRLGTGITLIPRLAIPENNGDDIVYLPVLDKQFKRQIGLFHRSSHPRLSLFNEVAECIRNLCGSSLKVDALSVEN